MPLPSVLKFKLPVACRRPRKPPFFFVHVTSHASASVFHLSLEGSGGNNAANSLAFSQFVPIYVEIIICTPKSYLNRSSVLWH